MRHFIVLLLLSVAGYVFWSFIPAHYRVEIKSQVNRHGFKLLAIVLISLALLVAAFYMPSLGLL